MSWAAMRDRMHSRVVAVLNDGCAQYQGPEGATVVQLPEVIVERNLMIASAEGMFQSDRIGFSWRKPLLETVNRGGVFTHRGERFVVEEVVADDGHMVTAACMVAP